MLSRQEFTQVALAAQADPRPLIEYAFSIQTKQLPGQAPVERLVLNGAQRRVHDAILKQRAIGRPPRVIVLKARQPGISTLACGYAAAAALTQPFANAMIVSHAEEPSVKLFKKIQFMLDRLPEELRPAQKASRRDEVRLAYMPCSDGQVELTSLVTVAAAGGQEPWRGQTLQFVHLSEFAWMPYPAETLIGIMPCVPKSPNTLVMIESTANGMGNPFHEEWLRAEAGESDFAPVFIGWWEIPEYQMTPPRDFVREPEEESLAKAYGLTNAQLQWRRYTIQSECRGDHDLFDQEYPSSPAMAFLVSGRPAFNIKNLREMYEHAQKVVPERGEVEVERLAAGDEKGFYRTPNGRFKVYRRPEPGHEYAIGADPSQGVEGGDPSCIQVYDRTRNEQVAVWHGWLEPYPFTHVLNAIGRWYNTAISAPECNSGYGFAVIEELKALQYPAIYVWQRVDKIRHSVTNFYGWATTMRTRELLVSSMHYALNAREMLLRDPDTVQECMQFQYVSGQRRAEGINNDDRVMAMMIAYRVHLEMPMMATGTPPRVIYLGAEKEPEQPKLPNAMSQDAWEATDADLKRLTHGHRTTVEQYDVPNDYRTEGRDFVPEFPW